MGAKTSGSLAGRVTLVTGATRGIGYHAALHLAREGSHIIALGRTQGGLEDLDDAIRKFGGEATLVPMDLRQLDGIDQLAAVIAERWGRLDGLLACAGLLGDITPAQQTQPKIFDEVFTVNMTANYRLIRAFDPLMRLSDAGRGVFLTSGVAESRRAFWSTYAASKSALEAFVQSYAREIGITKMRMNLLNPGAMRTAMRAKAMPGEDPETLPHPSEAAPLIASMLSPDWNDNAQIIDFRKTDFYTPPAEAGAA